MTAVRRFADNVLIFGRDTYGPAHTPLLADGINVETREPVRWLRTKNQKAPIYLSNLANQQILFRMLVGLSELTGEPKYRRAAVEAIQYAFAHLRSPNGLLYWGGHAAYDLYADRPLGDDCTHELKAHYPDYELMWQVDPAETRRLIEAFWGSHVGNWANLDFNRHGPFTRRDDNVWGHEYKGGPVFFKGPGLTFCNTGSDLIYAAAMLHHFTGEPAPLAWARRLARRYVEIRDPNTGVGGYQFSCYASGDRAQKQFGKEFGPVALEGRILAPGKMVRRFATMCNLMLQLSEVLRPAGPAGADLRTWASDDLKAYAKLAYDPAANVFQSMFNDGTPITGEDIRRPGYYRRSALRPKRAGSRYFWAYALAWRLTGDSFHESMVRSIASGHGLGRGGQTPGRFAWGPETPLSDPWFLMGLLELHRKTGSPRLLRLAVRVGDNILDQRFSDGFFMPDKHRLHARFDRFEPLALLRLSAVLKGVPAAVPRAWPGRSFFSFHHARGGKRADDEIYDRLRKRQGP